MENDINIGLESVENGDLEVGWKLFHRTDWWEARNTFANAYEKGNRDTLTLVGLGYALTRTDGIEQGLVLLFEAHDKESTPATRMILAKALADIGRYQDALDILGELSSVKDLDVTDELRAILLVRLGRIKDALPYYETLSDDIPNFAAGHLSFGLALFVSGELKRGRERTEKALQCHKDHGESIVRPVDLDLFQYEAACILANVLVDELPHKSIEGDTENLLLVAGEMFLRLGFQKEARRLIEPLEPMLTVNPMAKAHLFLDILKNTTGDLEAAEFHAREAVRHSGEDEQMSREARVQLATTIHQKHTANINRMVSISLSVNENRHQANHVYSAHYPGIAVLFTTDLDGGGTRLSQDYLEFVQDRYGHVEDLFEWCTGPGFLGYSMLAHEFTDHLWLADINPKAVHFAKKTREANCLEDRVEIFLSDNLDSIPESPKWDLVISNPPHFGGTEDYFLEIDRRGMDPGWRIHKKFFSQVGAHLKPDGELCIMEWQDENVPESSTPELFQPMLEENGFVMVDAITCKEVADHYYLIARKK